MRSFCASWLERHHRKFNVSHGRRPFEFDKYHPNGGRGSRSLDSCFPTVDFITTDWSSSPAVHTLAKVSVRSLECF